MGPGRMRAHVLTAAARLGQVRAARTLASGPGRVSRFHRVKWLKLAEAPIKRSWGRVLAQHRGRRSRPHPSQLDAPVLTKSRSRASGGSASSCSCSSFSEPSEKSCFPTNTSPFSSITITYPSRPDGTSTSSPRSLRPRNDTSKIF